MNWLWGLVISLVSAAATADPLPVADFFRHPAWTSAVMSPSGTHVAMALKGGSNGRVGLAVLDLRDVKHPKPLVAYSDADVRSIAWVNNERILFRLSDSESGSGDQIGDGLFAIDREGKGPERKLIERRAAYGGKIPGAALSSQHWLHSVLRDGTNDVVVQRNAFNSRREFLGSTLMRVDTVTGSATNISLGGPDIAYAWALDRKGEPRLAFTHFEGKSRMYWKRDRDSAWKQVWEGLTFARERDSRFYPFSIDASGTVYAVAPHPERDTQVLATIDMTSASPAPQTLLALDGYDFDGAVLYDANGGLMAIRYLTDARGTHWLDPRLRELQGKVDALMPGTINSVSCGDCKDPRALLVVSWSDRQPSIYSLYDVAKGTLGLLGESRPWIKASAMARREMKRFPARDGRPIPVHVTSPAGPKVPRPAVVLVHGGPNIRGGEWLWRADSQFLASRGYVVIEPEFRGSTGFGFDHFKAGLKQWGLAMQDDIADATRWAIEQGLADPKRICIAGRGYGGYAALMGLIRYPELYRCGIDRAGYTDFDLLFDPATRWSSVSAMFRDYGLPALVGDPVEDASQLEQTSPLKQAAKLKQPLLMAYNFDDGLVPIFHGTRMRDALKPHNRTVEWLEYRDEAHFLTLEADLVDFWTRVERFLERYLR